MSTPASPDIDAIIASRVRDRRTDLGLTIDELAKTSGVSRAMISKIERRETSPTATLLGRLCSALGMPMSAMFTAAEETAPVRRHAQRSIWRDPASGYVRSSVTPDVGPADIVEVVMPAGGDVSYDNMTPVSFEQYIWILEGALEVTYGDTPTLLAAGDCLHVRLDKQTRFYNPSPQETRYAVVLITGSSARRMIS
jgi:transcriptional regulator with XRE-family HTH domain